MGTLLLPKNQESGESVWGVSYRLICLFQCFVEFYFFLYRLHAVPMRFHPLWGPHGIAIVLEEVLIFYRSHNFFQYFSLKIEYINSS